MHISKNRSKSALHALRVLGATCPGLYEDMLERTPDDRVIDDLGPWVFLPDPEAFSKFCSDALGSPVVPFAIAAGEDIVACFAPSGGGNPGVVVIDPWSGNESSILIAELKDYEAWLEYAADVAREVKRREAEENNDW